MPRGLTHLDAAGRPRMVDVGAKADTERVATARGRIRMQPETFAAIKGGGIAKGDVLSVAQTAAIMAATVKTRGKTGVEMEALTAVSVGLLTVYDMCKAIDRGMEIESVRLDYKAGGKSGTYRRVDG